MGYIISFSLMLIGYTLIDWGHYPLKGEQVSMWYLLTGRSGPITSTSTATPSERRTQHPQ